MRSFLTRSSVIFALTTSAVLCSSFRLEAAASTSRALSAALDVDPSGAVLIPVMLNGQGPFPFLIDTGATASAVADTVVRRLGLSAAGKTLVSTSAGSAEFDLVNVASLSASGRDTANLRLAVLPSAALENAAPQAVGILGQDALRQASFTIDYEHATFSWGTSGDTSDSGRALTLRWALGRWLVALPQDSKNGRTLSMVADSGAAALVLFDRGTPLGLNTSPLDRQTDLTTVAGARKARGVIVRELRAGAATFRDLPAIIVDRRPEDADSDGLLPLCAFARVTFDVAAGTLTVKPRR